MHCFTSPCLAILLGLSFLSLPAFAADPTEQDYYPLYQLPIPEGIVLEGGGIQLLPDGKIAVSTRRGEIWMVENAFSETPADANGDNVYNVTIEVSDGNGGTDSQAIEVTVADANDAPVITTPPVVATVQEDSTLPVSGTIAATDADDGDVLSWSVVGGSAVGDADYTFSMDSLNVIKNGFTIFADGFDGGDPTPAGAAHRPVDVQVAPDGSLYISDDKGGTIWRVFYVGP